MVGAVGVFRLPPTRWSHEKLGLFRSEVGHLRGRLEMSTITRLTEEVNRLTGAFASMDGRLEAVERA